MSFQAQTGLYDDRIVDLNPNAAQTVAGRQKGGVESISHNCGPHNDLGDLLKCSTYAAEFSSKDDLYSHMSDHGEDLPLKCALCEEGFATQSDLAKHMPDHASPTMYQCEVWDKRYTSIYTLKKHNTRHTQDEHKCTTCGDSYLCLVGLETHTSQQHQVRSKNTVQKTPDSDSLINHSKQIQNNTNVNTLQGIAVFENSMKSDINIPKPSLSSDQSPPKCSIPVDQVVDLTVEVPDVQSERYTNPPNVLVIEPQESHMFDTAFNQNTGSFLGVLHSPDLNNNCSADMAPSSGFHIGGEPNVSVNQNTADRPQQCGVCGKGFALKDGLTKHMLLHTGERPYKCGVCGKRFALNERLIKHLTLHTQERPHKCSVCGKGFALKDGLKKHMMFHTGEKPYKCSVCSKGFAQKDGLTKHTMLHTGERPFTCSVCGKGFIRKYTLSLHMMQHTGNMPYKCKICAKGFTSEYRMTAHARQQHTGERPYKCTVCGKGFSLNFRMVKHRQTHKN